MIARQLLIGLMVMTTVTLASSRPVPQAESSPSRTLLHENHLSDDISSLYVEEQLDNPHYKADIIGLQLVGGSTPDCVANHTAVPGENNICGQYLANPPKFPRPLKDLAIQVWLLRTDGTTLVQKSRDNYAIGNAGEQSDEMMFVFDHVAPKELAGVVVRVDGKLFVRDIKSNQ